MRIISMPISTNGKPFVLREKPAHSAATFRTPAWEPSTIGLSGEVNVTAVRFRDSVPAPRVGGGFWWWDCAMIWLRSGEKKCARRKFSKNMHPRNGIEATHSELVRGHGLRRTKYRGLSRVSLSHYLMGAACNVKRYLNLLAFQMRTATLEAA